MHYLWFWINLRLSKARMSKLLFIYSILSSVFQIYINMKVDYLHVFYLSKYIPIHSPFIFYNFLYILVVEHCVSSPEGNGFEPREHTYC